MSSLYTYNTTTGVIVPDTATLRADLVAVWQGILGADLITTSDTVQGQIIDAQTEQDDGTVRLNAAVANQINPDLAEGVWLDAICALMGLERTAATYTTVQATLSGMAGVNVPTGSLAQTEAGDQFALSSDVQIGSDGTAAATFIATTAGPVACGAGALSQIVTSVLGWDGVTNSSAGTVGVAQQSDQSLRQTRRETLARQGQGTAEAILSAILDLDDVGSAVFRENKAITAQTIDGIELAPKSVWVCVDGGTDAEIGAALLRTVAGGIDTNGATSVTVTDATSGQNYTLTFDRPTAMPVLLRVTVRNAGSVTDPTTTIRAAVLAWAAGEVSGLSGLTVGADVSPWDVSAGIYAQVSGLTVVQVETSFASAVSWAVDTLAIALDEIATIASSSITVVEV